MEEKRKKSLSLDINSKLTIYNKEEINIIKMKSWNERWDKYNTTALQTQKTRRGLVQLVSVDSSKGILWKMKPVHILLGIMSLSCTT